MTKQSKPAYEQVMDTLKEIAIMKLEIDPDQLSNIDPQASIIESLTLDSINRVELFFEIEDRFRFQFELEDMNSVETMHDLIALIQERGSTGGSGI